MIIYCATNLINGKKYIGKDKKNNPLYLGSGKTLNKAIKKYGKESFKKQILAYAETEEFLNELEEYYIDYYSAQKSNLFYNIAKGGTGGRTCIDKSPFAKTIYQYSLDGNFVKEWNSIQEATRLLNIGNISSALNNKRESAGGFQWKYGRLDKIEQSKHKEEAINNRIPYPVLQLTVDGNMIKKWGSASEASKQLGLFRTAIVYCCNGKNKTSGGFKWVYEKDFTPSEGKYAEFNFKL